MKTVSRFASLVTLVALLGCGSAEPAADATDPPSPVEVPKKAEPPKKPVGPRPFARLFVQDLSTNSLKWADLRVGEKSEFTLDPLAAVDGFPPIDPARQKLVQMKEAGGLLCVGVRDDADGKLASGWALVHSGVGYIDHGDHGHWTFKGKPAVWDSRLDAEQGNPAHLYLYDGRFFLANDKLGGYTRIDPKKYERGKDGKLAKDSPRFLVGGGNHITLAVVDDKVGYSCWIDSDGPNKGRVDVTPVTANAKTEPAYSFTLPTGVIHGATACCGKVFFAPAAGVCWVDVDPDAKRKTEQVKIHHIDLGKDGDSPHRTGAFATHGHHVIFTTGKSASSALAILDAKAADPKPVFVSLAVKKGTQAVTPEVVSTAGNKDYVLVFHDRLKGSDAQDVLDVVALDPDGDGSFADAKVVKTLKVGKSAVDGHSGHHEVAFDADKQYAIFTNAGDGTISVLSLKSLEVVATFTVGGTPSAIAAVGSRETDD